MKRAIVSLGKDIRRMPENYDQKKTLAEHKKSLKKMVKNKKSEYKDTILQKMKWSNKKSKLFWKLLDKLRHNQNDQSFIAGISGERWVKHFSNVLQNKGALDEKRLPTNTTPVGPLDSEITTEEIKLASYILKNGKSPGIDNISNKMLSSLLEVKPEIIEKSFNSILKSPVIINN